LIIVTVQNREKSDYRTLVVRTCSYLVGYGDLLVGETKKHRQNENKVDNYEALKLYRRLYAIPYIPRQTRLVFSRI